jgi:pimeloyl-ACP methyl ester carboxylesterase
MADSTARQAHEPIHAGGEWLAAISGATREILDPADARPFAVVAEGDEKDAERAVAAALPILPHEDVMPPVVAERAALLRRVADLLVRDREVLGRLEAQDAGKTVEEGRVDIDCVADAFRYFADLVSAEPPVAGIGASSKLNLAFPQMVAGYDPANDPREPILSAEEKQVFVDTFRRTGFTGGINWYRNFTRNWQRSEGLDHTVRVPALMIMAENDRVLPPSAADGMERLVPDLEKYLVRGSGHWTQQEKPEEVSAKLIEWRRRRFG